MVAVPAQLDFRGGRGAVSSRMIIHRYTIPPIILLVACLPLPARAGTAPNEFSSKPCADGSQPRDPVPIRNPPPDYPAKARAARIQGTVIVSGRILRTGFVVDLKVLRGVHQLLDDATVKAVSEWRYEPAMCGDTPVEVFVSTSATFSLQSP